MSDDDDDPLKHLRIPGTVAAANDGDIWAHDSLRDSLQALVTNPDEQALIDYFLRLARTHETTANFDNIHERRTCAAVDRDYQIAQWIAPRIHAGEKPAWAYRAAMDHFGVSRTTARDAWQEYKKVFEGGG